MSHVSTNHEVIDSQSPYRGSFFSVQVDRIRLPNGREATREFVRHPGAAAVVPLRDGAVLLVRQNRHAVGSDLLEIPAGKLDVPGEAPADCARRELREETGYEAGVLEALGVFFSSRRAQSAGSSPGTSSLPAGISRRSEPTAWRFWRTSRTAPSLSGTTAAAPGWRTISRVASRPSGSRIRSTCTEKKLPR